MPLDRLMKAFASDEPGASGATTAHVEQLEKRFAEAIASHEEAMRDARDALAALKEHMTGAPIVHAPAIAQAASEAPPPENPVPNSEVMDAPSDPALGRLSYLSQARKAANAAIAPKQEPSRNRGKQSKQSEQSKPRKDRSRLLLYGCVVPVAILAAGGIVLSRHAVTAKPNPQHAVSVVKTQPAPLAQKAALPPAPMPAVREAALPPAPMPAVRGAALPPAAAPSPAPAIQPKPGQVETVVIEAVSLDQLQKKADAGDARAERDLGLKYLDGDGVAVDEAEAARLLLNAAYKGEPSAQYWLGTLYAGGRGLPTDAFQAAHWYEAAAKQGSIEAQIRLAAVYEQGEGVRQDLVQSYKWYAIASDLGDKTIAPRLAILAKRLKPADLAAAMQAAARFKAAPQDSRVNSASNLEPHSGG